jgi:hypothetical protein
MATKKVSARATQDFVPIEEVRDGFVRLKDGSLRSVLMVSSINIALKSENEQAAILVQFQNFLNSLDFAVQFFIQSRELDIRPYIALLEKRLLEQNGELMKIQVREYIEFIKGLTSGSSIMSKNFFVIVPYTPTIVSGGGALGGLLGGKKQDAAQKSADFEEHRSQIEQRVSIVQQGLARCGVRGVQLGTEEVIELFYKMFNIGELERPIPIEATKR